MSSYEAVIGLEIHIQLNTESKIFCSCKADSWADPPNANICPVCTGQPGVLPVPNQKVIEKAVLLARAMNADIQTVSFFDRKNYFYPDLPKGYQISQYDMPLATGGYLEIPLENGSTRTVTLEKLHIEEDAGKTIHKPGHRLLDYNRCGVPLVEMVTGPDLRSADEAAEFIKNLRQLTRWIGVSEADMEKGHLRFDANVSIRKTGETILNPKTEIKNVNSIEHVRDAINTEIKRQIKAVDRGETIESWTLDWDEDNQTLSKMRSKETEADYRYFREPDLLPVKLDQEQIQTILSSLPELPLARQQRLAEEYHLPSRDAEILTSEKPLADYFESTLSTYKGEPKQAANWVINEVMGLMNELNLPAHELALTPDRLAAILRMLDNSTINPPTAKDLIRMVQKNDLDPADIVESKGLAQLTDAGQIQGVCKEIIEKNPDQVGQYQQGKDSLIGWFIGQAMQETGGKADPQLVRSTFLKLLE